MSLDDINLVKSSESAKPDARLSANSIKLREETFNNTKKVYHSSLANNLVERIDDLKKELSEIEIKENDIAAAEEQAMDKSAAIAKLEGILSVVSGEEVPEQFIANRAIKLKEEWLENARANCKGAVISQENNVEEEKTELAVEPTTESISSEDDNPYVAKADVKDFYDTAFKEIESPKTEVEETPKFEPISREEIEKEINKKLQELSTPVEESVPVEVPISEVIPNYEVVSTPSSGYTDEVYKPMTDDEIAAAREKLELDQFQQIYADGVSNEPSKTDENIREEIVVTPEREENIETKEDEIEDFAIVGEEKEAEAVEEPAEARNIVTSAEDKAKYENSEYSEYSVEDLLKVVNDRKKAHAEKEEARNQAIKEKEEIERKRLEMEAEYAEKEEAIKKAIIEQIDTIDNSNTTLDNDIQNVKAETEDTKKDTESIEEKMAKLNEIAMMFSDDTEEKEEDKQKAR